MSFLEDADVLKIQVQEHLSIAEGLDSEKTLAAYVTRICESLEVVGYEIPKEFRLGDLISTVETIINADVSMEEDIWGDHLATAKKKSFFGRAVGAVKGAISRGVASVNTKMRRYHAGQADKALSKAADSDNRDVKSVTKAEKQYTKHYVKQQQYAKKLNPAAHAQITKDKANDFGIKHGSPEDARHRIHFARTLDPLHKQFKAEAPRQARAKMIKRTNKASKSQADRTATVKNTDPSAETNNLRKR